MNTNILSIKIEIEGVEIWNSKGKFNCNEWFLQ